MNVILLDTDVVSYLFKADSRAEKYSEIIKGKQLTVSFMTVAELYQWAAIHHCGISRITKMENYLNQRYAILPFDVKVCRYWGDIRAECRSLGRPISPQDAWVAATALAFEIPLLTNNIDDFKAVSQLQILKV